MTIDVHALESQLVDFLADGEWHKARDIRANLRITRDHMRAMPIFDDGRIMGSTTQGFKLTTLASEDEVSHAYNSMMSRVRHIAARAEAIRSAA